MANVRYSETVYDLYRSVDSYDDIDGFEPFKDLIQRNDAVCSNCFALRYDISTLEWWRASFGWSSYNVRVAIPKANDRIPASEDSHGTRYSCSNCGCQEGFKFRPVDKDSIVDYADNMGKTLDAREITYSRDVLLKEVKERNTSEHQGKQDSHVFAPALKEAMKTKL